MELLKTVQKYTSDDVWINLEFCFDVSAVYTWALCKLSNFTL